MAGAVAESLSRFALAEPTDAGEIARLQRENTMGGAIRLSMECQYGETDQVIVGQRSRGGLYGMGARSVRPMYVNGELRPVGYLGGLRLDPDFRGNPRAVIGGYQLFRELHEADGETRLYLTSILSDNTVARRFLEANIRGMPTYRFLCDYVTLVFPVFRWDRHSCLSRAGVLTDPYSAPSTSRGVPRAVTDRNVCSTQDRKQDRQFASPGEGPCLSPGHYRVVVRGYSPWLARLRPVVNLFRRPALPTVGQPLRMGYVSHIGDDLNAIALLQAEAAEQQFDYLVSGFDARDPRLTAVQKRFGGRTLHSRLYVVYWPDGQGATDALDGRFAGPEVALL